MSDEHPATKKLRLSEPDLKIILKYKDDDDTQMTKEYEVYANILASMSKFVDASLSIEMKEKAEGVIVMQDVTPEVFDVALLYMSDPSAARSATPEDIIKVVEFYDKYEFSSGLKLCDDILHDFFTREMKLDDKHPPENLDLLVDCIVLAEQLSLDQSKTSGLDYLESRFGNDFRRFGATMFSVEHVRKMHPMFKKGLFPDIIQDICADLTKEELDSPCFPRYFVGENAYQKDAARLREVLLCGAGCNANGTFVSDRTIWQFNSDRMKHWDGQSFNFCIRKDIDWYIVAVPTNDGENEAATKVLWKSPHSSNALIPPRRPWIPVDPFAKAKEEQPTLAYDTFFSIHNIMVIHIVKSKRVARTLALGNTSQEQWSPTVSYP